MPGRPRGRHVHLRRPARRDRHGLDEGDDRRDARRAHGRPDRARRRDRARRADRDDQLTVLDQRPARARAGDAVKVVLGWDAAFGPVPARSRAHCLPAAALASPAGASGAAGSLDGRVPAAFVARHHRRVAARRARAARRACRARRSRPRSSTTIWSASRTVDSRCAITIVVRPSARRSSASCTARSVCDVERARRLVEHQHRRVAQDGARDRDPLLLAAGEAEAALADDGVVAVGQRGDQCRGSARRARRPRSPRRSRRAARSAGSRAREAWNR